MYCTCSVWSLFIYIYQQLSSVRLQKFVVSFTVCIFPLQTFVVSLQNLVVSASFITKVWSARFQTTKVCSVRIFNHKSLQCPHFSITKVCSVRFQTTKACGVRIFLVQKFVVSTFSDYKSLYCCFVMSLTLCRYMGTQFNVSEQSTLVKQPSINIPSRELQSRLTREWARAEVAYTDMSDNSIPSQRSCQDGLQGRISTALPAK